MELTITRKLDVVKVLLLKHKTDYTYSYINLTKMHICPCKFENIRYALEDLKTYPRVISYTIDSCSESELIDFVESSTGSKWDGTNLSSVLPFNVFETCFYLTKIQTGSFVLECSKRYHLFVNIEDLIKNFEMIFTDFLNRYIH